MPWGLEQHPPATQPLGQTWSLDQHPCVVSGRRRQRIRDDRRHDRASPPTQRRCEKKAGEDQAIGRSKGGLSSKFHVLADALGNPLKILLTAGQIHDLAGADALLPGLEAKALLADKAFDADKRVINPLEAAGITAVIP